MGLRSPPAFRPQEHRVRTCNIVRMRLFLFSVASLIPLALSRSSLAAGASVLLKPLTSEDVPPNERVDVTKRVKDLTVEDWALIIRAFGNWPFAPNADVCIFSSLQFLRSPPPVMFIRTR